MTGSTTRSEGLDPFETTFSTVSTVLGVVLLLLAVVVFWTGFQGSAIPVVGFGLTMITGSVGALFALFFAGGAFIAAFYMEPGFDQ